MKHLNQIQVGRQSAQNVKENFINYVISCGTGCCWDTMAEMYYTVYGIRVSESEFKDNFARFKASAEEEYGEEAHLDESGDPSLAQANYLLAFINGYFNSSNHWNNPTASYGFGIMRGSGNDSHAVIVNGGKQYDPSTMSYYYNVYDVSNASEMVVRAEDMLGVAPISAKVSE